MHILQTGLSHKTAPIEIREQLALSETDLPNALRKLCPETRDSPGDPLGGAILSTCNRLEVYAAVQDLEQGQQQLQDLLSEFSGLPRSTLEPYLQVWQDRSAVAHLCEVACGLESMVLGESQIQGQVAQAYELALRHGATEAATNALFRTALRAGKRARTETAIDEHPVSISHVAVELASQVFDGLAQKSALLIGAGEMAEMAARNLFEHGVRELVVVNRSAERARHLAQQYGGTVVDWHHLAQALCSADIVISSTAAPHAILDAKTVATAMRVRRNRFLFIIDIAVPRDVDPAVGNLSNVFLYDIDNLQQVVDANLERRKREVPLVQRIIDQEVAEFMTWFRSLDVVPTIVELRNHVECIRDSELRWAMGKLGHLSRREQEVVLSLAERIVNKILHRPTVRLKEHAVDPEAYRYVETLHDLFGLSDVRLGADEERSDG
jgi:glutamyl-tRNA reductase